MRGKKPHNVMSINRLNQLCCIFTNRGLVVGELSPLHVVTHKDTYFITRRLMMLYVVTNRQSVGTTSMEIEDRRTHSSYDHLQYKILSQNFSFTLFMLNLKRVHIELSWTE